MPASVLYNGYRAPLLMQSDSYWPSIGIVSGAYGTQFQFYMDYLIAFDL
jgi:hypothetical protein